MPDTPSPASPLDDDHEWDPTFLNCRREALTALGIWFLALSWTVPFCYLNGYPGENFDPENLSTVFGIPSWTFWGVVVPWLVCDVVTVWFCFFYMRDDHLGAAPEDAADAEGGA